MSVEQLLTPVHSYRSSHILLSHLTLPGTEPHLLAKGFAYQPSIAMLVAIGYQLYYFYLEPVAGVSLTHPNCLPL
jgi:hypothetical protein